MPTGYSPRYSRAVATPYRPGVGPPTGRGACRSGATAAMQPCPGRRRIGPGWSGLLPGAVPVGGDLSAMRPCCGDAVSARGRASYRVGQSTR
jgi:hypothetical protein